MHVSNYWAQGVENHAPHPTEHQKVFRTTTKSSIFAMVWEGIQNLALHACSNRPFRGPGKHSPPVRVQLQANLFEYVKLNAFKSTLSCFWSFLCLNRPFHTFNFVDRESFKWTFSHKCLPKGQILGKVSLKSFAGERAPRKVGLNASFKQTFAHSRKSSIF